MPAFFAFFAYEYILPPNGRKSVRCQVSCKNIFAHVYTCCLLGVRSECHLGRNSSGPEEETARFENTRGGRVAVLRRYRRSTKHGSNNMADIVSCETFFCRSCLSTAVAWIWTTANMLIILGLLLVVWKVKGSPHHNKRMTSLGRCGSHGKYTNKLRVAAVVWKVNGSPHHNKRITSLGRAAKPRANKKNSRHLASGYFCCSSWPIQHPRLQTKMAVHTVYVRH